MLKDINRQADLVGGTLYGIVVEKLPSEAILLLDKRSLKTTIDGDLKRMGP